MTAFRAGTLPGSRSASSLRRNISPMRYSVSELSDVIRDRRSIQPKDLGAREVQRDILERLVQNAVWAPNHGMTQPWRFTVFSGEGRKRLSAFLGAEYTRLTPPEKFLPKKFENHVQRPLQASAIIALGVARDPHHKISALEEQFAMACAVQNMYLTCTAYGLGGFWSTGAASTGDGIRTFLGLGPEDSCLGLLYVGYPAIEWPKGYRKPWIEFVKWEE